MYSAWISRLKTSRWTRRARQCSASRSSLVVSDRTLFSSGNRRLRKNLLQYAVVRISFQYSLNFAYNSLNDLAVTATADSTTFRLSFAQSSPLGMVLGQARSSSRRATTDSNLRQETPSGPVLGKASQLGSSLRIRETGGRATEKLVVCSEVARSTLACWTALSVAACWAA